MTHWNNLTVPFAFPSLAGQRVLLLGLGGGCDIITAWLLAQLDDFTPARAAIYANTKKRPAKGLVPIGTYLSRVSDERVLPLASRSHGSANIDRAMPRGPEGCPWIACLPEDFNDDGLLAGELRAGNFDLILGVDTGGDSLFDQDDSIDGNRDRRMWRVVRRTGIPAQLIVVAPGSDGEVQTGKLATRLHELEAAGRYRGCLSMVPLLDRLCTVLDEMGPGLQKHRTPNIMRAAADGRLEEKGSGVVVPRGVRPVVPRDWLLSALVFSDPDGGVPSP